MVSAYSSTARTKIRANRSKLRANWKYVALGNAKLEVFDMMITEICDVIRYRWSSSR